LGLVEPGGWNRRSCGSGAKGPRYYDWAWIATDHQDSKSTVGLDRTQVRLYRAWKRHVTLAMAALAFLAVLAAIEKKAHLAPMLPEDPDQARRPTAAVSR
jgi:hypothetical protein